jgi:putative DNA primase/helicase
MEKPQSLPVEFDQIPFELKKIPRWVMWRFVEVGEGESRRWSKLPVQSNLHAASSTNPSTWTDFLSAQNAYQTGKFDGVGFVFDGSDGLVGIDLDDCYAEGQFTAPGASQIAESIPGYMEVSPSGTGVKIFTLAAIQSAHVDHDKGLEIYPRGRYFTVTGQHIGGAIPASPIDLSPIIPERSVRVTGDAFADYTPPVAEYDVSRVETELLAHIDANCGYTDWLRVGMALHHQFNGDVEACEAWDRWSATTTGNYHSGECARKWDSFTKGKGATLRSIIFEVNQTKKKEALARGEIVLELAPLDHAQEYLESEHTNEEGTTLVHYASEFFKYTGNCYESVEDATVRSKMYTFLNKCKKTDRRGNLIPFAPTPPSVSAAIDALQAIIHLPQAAHSHPPVWLDGFGDSRPEASKLISLKNGLFHLEDSVLLPHTLGFFTLNSLPFEYDPKAECPVWEEFLRQLWEHDPESVDTLQEIFGYILSGETDQQKFFNIIGPRRSGKGTINKVLVDLLGQHNTVAPELGELCDTFGLQPWLGKLLASFTDARAPERNRSAVVSQLLRIVGGDTVTVNRKNKEAWNGYLPTRIVIYSNEVMQLTENSNALTGRMIVLKMTNSFYGREDTQLSAKLKAELSGIFNWSMVGLRRRLARGGKFMQPKSGTDLLRVMEELSNPLGSFFDDVLVLDSEGEVCKDDLYHVFKKWSMNKGLHPGTDLTFKRKFLAATGDKPITTAENRANGNRVQVYRGIRLTPKAQQYADSLNDTMEREEVF